MSIIREIEGVSVWPWIWFAVALALAILLWHGQGGSVIPPAVRFVDREVVRTIPIEKIRVEKRVDTVVDIKFIKNTTDRYFLEKRILEVDSLRRLIRDYAAARGDSIEQVVCADTVVCHESGCDTVSVQFLSLANVFRVSLAPAPRKIVTIEKSLLVEREVFPLTSKLQWSTYGLIAGALGAWIATRSER